MLARGRRRAVGRTRTRVSRGHATRSAWRRLALAGRRLVRRRDDARPILFHRDSAAPRLVSILGSKLDNIFDVYDYVDATLEGATPEGATQEGT